MPTEYFIIALFCRVDDMMIDVKKHTQATLYPSEVVTLALLFALKGREIATFTAGWSRIGCTCFRACLIAAACFACSTRIRNGWTGLWLHPA